MTDARRLSVLRRPPSPTPPLSYAHAMARYRWSDALYAQLPALQADVAELQQELVAVRAELAEMGEHVDAIIRSRLRILIFVFGVSIGLVALWWLFKFLQGECGWEGGFFLGSFGGEWNCAYE